MSTFPGRGHVPVLLDEVLRSLDPQPGETYLDCTAGAGGHAAAIASRLGPSGRVILLDVDPANLAAAASRLREVQDAPQVEAIQANFALAESVVRRLGVQVNLLLADLGVASTQLDDPGRGLSFMHPGPLDMRLDPTLTGTAADLVNALPERRLATLIADLGEEPMARRIAARVAEARAHRPITTTEGLAELVREAYGSRAKSSRNHPATRTFMALRIAVNDELGALDRLLESIGRDGWLAPGGRAAIISFHSLEDRRVKHAFRALARSDRAEELTRKPVEPAPEEARKNPRSRSAKLRVLRLVGRC